VSAVLVLGSVASGLVDERSDIDILVICRSRLIPLAARKHVLPSVGGRWSYHRGPDVHHLFADQDVDGLVEEIPVTIAYQAVAWIENVLIDVFDRGAISTSKVPFRP
jgi:predicted nucleotidyltransferase